MGLFKAAKNIIEEWTFCRKGRVKPEIQLYFQYQLRAIAQNRTEQNIVRYYSQVKQMYGATGFRSVDVGS